MADIILQVGAVSVIDVNEIKGQIQAIANELAKLPEEKVIKIKPVLSGATATDIKNLSKDLDKMLGSVDTTSVSAGLTNGIQAASDSMKMLGKDSATVSKAVINQVTNMSKATDTAARSFANTKEFWAALGVDASHRAQARKYLDEKQAQKIQAELDIRAAQTAKLDKSFGIGSATKSAAASADAMKMAWAMETQDAKYTAEADKYLAQWQKEQAAAAAAAQQTTTAMQQQINTLTGIGSATKSAAASADAMKMAWAMEAQAERDAATAGRENLARMKTTYKIEDIVSKGDSALAKYSLFKNGTTSEQAMYTELESSMQALNAMKQTTGGYDMEQVTAGIRRVSVAIQEIKTAADAAAESTAALESATSTISKGKYALSNWGAMQSGVPAAQASYQALQGSVVAAENALSDFNNNSTPGNLQNLVVATRNLNTQLKETGDVAEQSGTKCKSLLGQLLSMADRFTGVAIALRAIRTASKTLREMAQQATSVDDAMTQIRVVTNESDLTYQRFGNDVAETAQKIGASMTDIIDSTTVFSRLGYSLDESYELAQMVTELSRVGDIDVSSAQSSITSVIKAFDIDATDIESVMDKMVTVGNNFPISVSEIATGMTNASSALSASGNSLEESIALLTAANTTLQDAAKSSTGLRTITARIRKTDTELNDLGETMTEAHYEELVSALSGEGIKLTDVNGEYRSTYAILQDIAAAWDSMSTSKQAAMAELLAGNRQQVVFYSIIKNFQEVAEASMEAMSGSDGSMASAYTEYMNSVTAHAETFNAAIEGLSVTFMDTDFLSGLYDAGTAIVNLASGIVKITGSTGGLLLAASAFTTLVTSIKSLAAAQKGGAVINTFSDLFKVAKDSNTGSNIIKYFSGIATGAREAGAAAAASGGKIKGFFAAVGGGVKAGWSSMSLFSKIALGITAVTTAYTLLRNAEESRKQALQTEYNDAISVATTSNQENAELLNLYTAYENASSAYDGNAKSKAALTSATNALAEALGYEAEAANNANSNLGDLTRGELEQAVRNAEAAQIAAEKKANNALNGITLDWSAANQKGFINSFAHGIMPEDVVSGAVDTSEEILDVYDAMIEQRDELIGAGDTDSVYYDTLVAAISYLKPYADDIESANAAVTTAQDTLDKFNSGNFNSEIDEAADEAATTAEKVSNSMEDVSGAVEGAQKALDFLKDQEAGISISAEDLNSGDLQDYISALEYANGVYRLNADAVKDIVEAKMQEQLATVSANKANAQADYLNNAAEIEKYRKKLKESSFEQGETASSIQETIDALLSENQTLKSTCDQCDAMAIALSQVTSAYQTWLSAKDAGQSGDMFDDTLEAIELVNETLNDATSEYYRRTGRSDYRAALDFVIPDSVDKSDEEAVQSYLESVSDLFTVEDSKIAGLDIPNFLQAALDKGLLEEDGDSLVVAGEKTMQDFADGMNLSLPLVQAIFGELEEYGAEFAWAQTDKTMGDLGVAAYEAAEALREIDGFDDLQIVMDVSSFKSSEIAVESIEDSLTQLKDFKARPEIAADEGKIGQINDMISYLVAQKQEIEAPAIMSVDASGVKSDIAPAIKLLQRFQQAENELEINTEIGADTTKAQSAVDGLVTQIQSLDPEVLAKLGIDSSSEEAIRTSIANITATGLINLGVDKSLIAGYTDGQFTATGTVDWRDDVTNLTTVFSGVGYVYWKNANNPTSQGGAGGVASAGGSRGFAGGSSLVGELGREIIVDPSANAWYTVGNHGAEFVDIPKGAIIFNHKQTDALLRGKSTAGRGKAFAAGIAPNLLGMWGTTRYLYDSDIKTAIKGRINKSLLNKKAETNKTSKSGGGGSDSSAKDEDLEVVDWIEIAIDRIERIIESFGRVADSTFKSLSSRMDATVKEASKITEEISLQQQAYNRYLKEADSVNLSASLKALVRDGAIDISKYDKDTKELIDDYQEWYEKALDCADSVEELHESLAELYQEKFEAIQADYSNKLELMEKQTDALQNKLDILKEQGYVENANYYRQMQDIEKQNISTLNKEIADLSNALGEAMASGEIDEGSEAWYEMKLGIEETKAAIDDANLSLAEFANTIQQIEWDYFDYAQERISDITSEAEFLLNLIDGEDTVGKDGNPTSAGTATLGLNAEKYSVYMTQASKYAGELQKINKQLASDPSNKTLLERRNELLESQRESILAAKEEKDTMIELVRDGIDVELEAVQELIDAYTDSLDSAKDLYDYQKQISEKTSDIASLEKQLAAYQNDSSEETRAKIQKLQSELKEAQDDLRDTEYERFVSETKEALSSMYDEYEEVLNARFDDVDALFEKLIEYVNANYAEVKDYLNKETEAVGYAITEATTSIWANGGIASGVVSTYGSEVSMKLTTVGIAVENICSILESIAQANGISFGMKSYSTGGLVDYTGLASVHGSGSNPELVLNATDTKNFILLRDALRSIGSDKLFGSALNGNNLAGLTAFNASAIGSAGVGGYSVGAINVSIPIDHVSDYNDFVNQLRDDRQFEQMIQDVTIGRVAGKNSLGKNKYRW